MDDELKVAALGRNAAIGDLYNAKTDSFTGTSGLTSAPSGVRDFSRSSKEVRLLLSTSLGDKYSSLDGSVDQKLSLLVGLQSNQLKGVVEFLAEKPKHEQSIVSALMYTLVTKSQSVNLQSDDSFLQSISVEAVTAPEVTHIVTGVTWGCRVVVAIEFNKTKDSDDDLHIQGYLYSVLQKLKSSIECGGGASCFDDDKNVSLRVYCDVPPHKLTATSFSDVYNILTGIPQRIGALNGGKGVPLSFSLLSVTPILDTLGIFEEISREVPLYDESEFQQFVGAFSKLSDARQRLNQCGSAGIPQPLQSHLQSLTKETEEQQQNLLSEVKSLVVKFRNGEDIRVISATVKIRVDNINNLCDRISQFVAKLQTKKDNATSKSSNLVDDLVKKGLKLLKKEEALDAIIQKYDDVYVLYFSADFIQNDAKTWDSNKAALLQVIDSFQRDDSGSDSSSDDLNVIFVGVDCQLRPDLVENNSIHRICIYHYKNGSRVTRNLIKGKSLEKKSRDAQLDQAKEKQKKENTPRVDKESEQVKDEKKAQNFAKTISWQKINSRPREEAVLELPCPGTAKGCSPVVASWRCDNCHQHLIYGFDNHFYCFCGRAAISSYTYKCNSSRHGPSFVSYDQRELQVALSKLIPAKELNILILGETGVGKSTWINAFLNYCSFSTLEEAASSNALLYHIASQFTMMDANFQQRIITIGEDSNEDFTPGHSATKSSRAYRFPFGNYLIRLIDTPGIGDVGGFEQDKKNFDGILSFLTDVPELHGICILLKPNNARLTVMFRFCIQELLTHLHKDAVNNIVFCFTNSRSTFYRPGDTFPALQKLLGENPDVNIPLAAHTVYCMDNEAFRFLAALKNGIQFEDSDRNNFAGSWNQSVTETNRLLQYIMTKDPHFTEDSLSLNGARQMVVDLTRPIADLSQNIQLNIDLINREKDKITFSKQNSVELAKNLQMPQVDIVSIELDYPMTVCTSESCRELIQIGDIQKWHYSKQCHDHCYLDGIDVEKIGHPGLQSCSAMGGSSTCQECSCHWNLHMHITYDTKPEQKMVINQNVQKQITSEEDAISAIQLHMSDLEQRKRELEHEQREITKICAHFGSFLKANAITTYNDALNEYMEHLIRMEKDKVAAGGDRKTLEGLEKTLEAYKEEVRVLNDAIKSGGGKKVDPAEIPGLIQQLYSLPIKGKELKQMMEAKKHGDYVNRLGSNQSAQRNRQQPGYPRTNYQQSAKPQTQRSQQQPGYPSSNVQQPMPPANSQSKGGFFSKFF